MLGSTRKSMNINNRSEKIQEDFFYESDSLDDSESLPKKKKISLHKSYLDFKKEDFQKKLIQTVFINLIVQNNFEGFVALVDLDFGLLCIIFVDVAVHFIGFGKHYIQHNSRFMKIMLTMLFICLIIGIMTIAQISSYRNEKLTDTKDVVMYDHYFEYYTVDGQFFHEDEARAYPLLLIGFQNICGLIFSFIQFESIKYRIRKIKDLKQTAEKKLKEKHYLQIFENQGELRPLEKAYRKIKEYKKRIPLYDKEIHQDFSQILRALKEALVIDDYKRNRLGGEDMESGNNRGFRRKVSNIQIAQLQHMNTGMLSVGQQPIPEAPNEGGSEDVSFVQQQIQYSRTLSYLKKSHLDSSQPAIYGGASNMRLSLNNARGEFTVDPIKLSMYLSNYNQGLINCLENIDSFEFDIFNLKKISNGKELIILGYEIAQQYNLIEVNNIDKFTYLNFLQGVSQSYNNVAYHSKTHASDVLQSLHYYLKAGKLIDILQLTPLDHLGCIISALAHDLDHPGLNNSFLVNTKDEIALLYNDQSVLENHHVAQTFLLLRQEELDIFKKFSSLEYTRIREIMIKLVLATDMQYHNQNIQQMKQIVEKVNGKENVSNNQSIISEEEFVSNKLFLMGQAIHFADISNPCRSWTVSQRWTDLVFREFFYQGDLERAMGLPISNLMDKRTVNIAQSQVGFITFLVEPSIKEFCKLCNTEGMKPLLAQLAYNKVKWEELKEVFDTYQDMLHSLDIVSTQMSNNQPLNEKSDYFNYQNYLQRQKDVQLMNKTQAVAAQSTTRNSIGSGKSQNKFNSNLVVSQNQRMSVLTKRSSILKTGGGNTTNSPALVITPHLTNTLGMPKSPKANDDQRIEPVFKEKQSQIFENCSISEVSSSGISSNSNLEAGEQQVHDINSVQRSKSKTLSNVNLHQAISKMKFNGSSSILAAGSSVLPSTPNYMGQVIPYSDLSSSQREAPKSVERQKDKHAADRIIDSEIKILGIQDGKQYSTGLKIKPFDDSVSDHNQKLGTISDNSQVQSTSKNHNYSNILRGTGKIMDRSEKLRQNEKQFEKLKSKQKNQVKIKVRKADAE